MSDMASVRTSALPVGRRIRLAGELLILFYGLPLAYVLGVRPPFVFGGLWVGAAVALWVLLHDSSFDRCGLTRIDLRQSAERSSILRVVGWRLFVVGCVLAVAGLCWFQPGLLFSLPRRRPVLWVAVVILYPLLSVYPQELIWRTLFFHRYGALFGRTSTTILASSFAFAWVHVVMLNPFAVVTTLAGGLIFGQRFARTGSTLAASFEHTLYGLLVFTVGLGAYSVQGGVFSK